MVLDWGTIHPGTEFSVIVDTPGTCFGVIYSMFFCGLTSRSAIFQL